MPSTDSDERARRIEAARRRILADAPDPFPDVELLARQSARLHAKEVAGDTAPEPTEVVVRLHGDGVDGHRVAVEHAAPVLDELQRAIKWIGASIRRDWDQALQGPSKKRDRQGLADATRMFLQPQFGAGSLIFHLTADSSPTQADTLDLGLPPDDSLLDRSVQRLLDVITDAQADAGDDIGELTESVRGIGSRAAAAIDRVAAKVVKDDIDIDLTWSNPTGSRRSANLRRRGALAIQDAVKRHRVHTEVIELTGVLETASVGKDPIRIETGSGKPYKMAVDPELGKRLGPLLNQRVVARAEETVTWKPGGNETRRYVLLAVELERELPF